MLKNIDVDTLRNWYNDVFHCENKRITRKRIENEIIRLKPNKDTIHKYELITVENKNKKFKEHQFEDCKKDIKLASYRNLWRIVKSGKDLNNTSEIFRTFKIPKTLSEYNNNKLLLKIAEEYTEYHTRINFSCVTHWVEKIKDKITVYNADYLRAFKLICLSKFLPSDLLYLLNKYL